MQNPPAVGTRQLGQLAVLCALMIAACSAQQDRPPPPRLTSIPAAAEYCLAAQRLLTNTTLPMQLIVHTDFDAFVKSKAVIEGPTIQQYEWRSTGGQLLGISCKLKSADHLVATFGPGSAGPDRSCQDFNRAMYVLLAPELRATSYPRLEFDPAETVTNERNPGMTGPDWLAPFTLTTVDADGALRLHSKGFVVDFTDPRFAQMPVRFRGVHYCHFIAPEHLREVLEGRAHPGAVIGRLVEADPGAMGR